MKDLIGVYEMPKVYTRHGDSGETGLLYGGRIKKNDPRTDAYGTIDEAVSALGIGRSFSQDTKVKEIILKLQRDLFSVGAELATDVDHYDKFLEHFTPVDNGMVDEIEDLIDELQEDFELPPFFVLPGATPASAGIDLARSVLRRAERLVVSLDQSGSIRDDSSILPYINRVSDLLFILARYEDRGIDSELLNDNQ